MAAAVNLSPAHLTTTVRRKTGSHRAGNGSPSAVWHRHGAVVSDLIVEEIAPEVGYADPGYLVRSFGRAQGTTPLRWRRAGRP